MLATFDHTSVTLISPLAVLDGGIEARILGCHVRRLIHLVGELRNRNFEA